MATEWSLEAARRFVIGHAAGPGDAGLAARINRTVQTRGASGSDLDLR
ncbi:hypothetical protein J2T57_001486 [Natronocella acetinitrilica]|uniref:Uncharacterized protein n=1 Tax=Natronocella acetinitrilica TaxID=414046 RepID=A0AAE3G3H8_9GAMM|nr:hypothetical protein [Natronocella acetinitrilica]MCP1674384.1 hypothetical protein [Natronocella acetinitrilica]